ncbi:peamaclein [Zea mays]|nr:peamaclein [Zea mays]|eukprot:XP_008665087.1 peamaclein [Zea mays]
MAKPPLQTATIILLVLLVAASCLHTVDAAALGFSWGKCCVRCARTTTRRAREACMSSCGLKCEFCKCGPAMPPRDIHDCPCYRNMLTASPKKRPKYP